MRSVVSVDPRRLSAGRMSEASSGFSAASSVSWHQACGLQPCCSCRFQRRKLRVLLTGLEVSQQTNTPPPPLQIWTHFIYVYCHLWSHLRLSPSETPAVVV